MNNDIFIIGITFVAAYAVLKGVEVIGRISVIFVWITAFFIFGTTLLLIGSMKFPNLLPVFEVPPEIFLKDAFLISKIPYGEVLSLLMFSAYLNNNRKITKNMFSGMIIGSISLLVVVTRNALVLGDVQAILLSPAFQAIRLIDFGSVFTRMDMVIAVSNTFGLLLKICIFYFAVVIATAQMFGLKSYRPLLVPIGYIAIVFSKISFESSVELFEFSVRNYSFTMMVPAYFVFPSLALLIAVIRKLPQNKACVKSGSGGNET